MMGLLWKMRSLLRLSAVCWLAGVCGPVTADDVWIDIDTDSRSLTVMDEDNVLRVFENISVGRNGVTSEKVVKDRKTPLAPGADSVSDISLAEMIYKRQAGDTV